MSHLILRAADVLHTAFKSSGDSEESASVLLNCRATSKEVLYDSLTKQQQGRMDAAMKREWDKWNELGVTGMAGVGGRRPL